MELNIIISDYLVKAQIKDWLRLYDERVGGNKDELIERLLNSSDFELDDLSNALYNFIWSLSFLLKRQTTFR